MHLFGDDITGASRCRAATVTHVKLWSTSVNVGGKEDRTSSEIQMSESETAAERQRSQLLGKQPDAASRSTRVKASRENASTIRERAASAEAGQIEIFSL